MLVEHRWIAKALIQKTISATGAIGAYHLAQRVAGQFRGFHPRSRMRYAALLAADVGIDQVQGATVVEIGTGWVPVVPVALSLLGVRRVLSYDLTAHLMPALTMQILPRIGECLGELAEASGVPLVMLRERFMHLAAARDFEDLVTRVGLEYHAPEDVTGSALLPASVDILYSNLVFEHVTPAALLAILAYSHRLLRPAGVAWHHIDYTDHYAHTFRGLSYINFLRYSERAWRALGQSELHYQNRLRRSDYVRAFESTGFKLLRCIDHHGVQPESVDRRILADPFAHLPLEELTCTGSRFVLTLA